MTVAAQKIGKKYIEFVHLFYNSSNYLLSFSIPQNYLVNVHNEEDYILFSDL